LYIIILLIQVILFVVNIDKNKKKIYNIFKIQNLLYISIYLYIKNKCHIFIFEILLGIIENFAVIFYVYVKNESTPLMDYDQETRQFGTLTFYIPAIIV